MPLRTRIRAVIAGTNMDIAVTDMATVDTVGMVGTVGTVGTVGIDRETLAIAVELSAEGYRILQCGGF
jgi:hypothetical protein